MIIPANRRVPWVPGVTGGSLGTTVGVPGGIPTNRTEFVNVQTVGVGSPYYCVADGVTGIAAPLQAAIKACPPGKYVYMPAGVYAWGDSVTIPANVKNWSIRGAGTKFKLGAGGTVLKGINGVGRFAIGSGTFPSTPSIQVTAGTTVGSNVFTVTDAGTVVVGNTIGLQMDTPTWMHKITAGPNGADAWKTNFQITFKVTAKTQTTVTVTPALPFDITQWNPRLVPWTSTLCEGVGIEDLTIDTTLGSNEPVTFSHAWGCWLKNVECFGTGNKHFKMLNVSASEIRKCYTHDTRNMTSPNHEGIDFAERCCWNLIEDNICVNAGKPAIIYGDAQGNCFGNVTGYNYIQVDDPGGISNVFVTGISDSHGQGNMFNLYEGNVAHGFKADGYWGSSAYGTILRNWFHNDQVTNFARALSLEHYSVYYNVVGNILGTPNRTSLFDTKTYGSKACIYRFGYPNSDAFGYGNSPEGVSDPGYQPYGKTIGPTTPPDYTASLNNRTDAQALDLNVENTIIRHGNFDFATRIETRSGSAYTGYTSRSPSLLWEIDDSRGTGVGFADHVIVPSYYLAAANTTGMVWGSITWPVMAATSEADALTKIAPGCIPAWYRYLNQGVDPGGSPAALTRISVTPTLDFDVVFVGSTLDLTFVIRNEGNTPLTIDSITPPTGFTVSGLPGVMPSGVAVIITATFTPVASITYSGNIVVASDATEGNNICVVNGSGTVAATPVPIVNSSCPRISLLGRYQIPHQSGSET